MSRLDCMIAQDMVKSGRVTVAQIEQGLREASPNAEVRKADRVDNYAQRTAAKAWTSPEVQAYRQEQSKKAQLQRQRTRGGPGLG